MTTMLADPPTGRTRLGVGFDSSRNRSRDPEAWRRAIGTKRIPARLALLPEQEKRWDRIGVSAVVQLLILAFFLAMPIFFPERIPQLKYEMVRVFMPETEIPVAPPPPPPPKVKAPEPKPEPIEEAKLSPKQPHIFVEQKVFQPDRRVLEAKAPEIKTTVLEPAKLETKISQPKRPRDEVKVNNFNTGSAAPATVKLPPEKVQTGGFGDPNGLAGPPVPNKVANVNRSGALNLPPGPGYGNGTGGDKGVRGTVASAGFGNGTAIPPTSSGKHGGTVQSAGIADASQVTEAPKKRALPSESPTTMVEILDKPRPQYTAEGRKMRIEGDVVLDLVFLANGTVQVNNVVRGLGHGLDEAAVRAAQQIKFKPAKRDGQPVDSPARVHVEFQLAY
jgi:TonB family protein